MSPRSRKDKDEKIERPNERSKNRKPGDLHTIASFCIANAFSQSKYYDLKRKGKGPREIEIDGRILITPEAEADWRREREAATAKKRQAAKRKQQAEATA